VGAVGARGVWPYASVAECTSVKSLVRR